MKNKGILIGLIILILIALFSFLILQNNNDNVNKVDDVKNKSNTSINTSEKNISQNITSINNLIKDNVKSEKDYEPTKKSNTPFKVPENAELSYVQAKMIADGQCGPGEYAKITKIFKDDGDLLWRVKIYDKKTGKMVGTFVIDDKRGSIEAM